MNRHKFRVKLVLGLFFIGIVFPAFTLCQQEAPIFKDLKDPQILKLLFDTKKIDPNGVALWKPNFSDSREFEFNISSDGLCHTNIDTIMEYPGSDSKEDIIIFTTYGIDRDGKKQDCHACAPYLSIAILSMQKNNSWKLAQFKKHFGRHGQYGLFDGESLQKMGDKTYGLKLEGTASNMGENVSWTVLYDLKSLDQIFSCTAHADNSGEFDSSPKYGLDRKLEFIPEKNSYGYYDILVTLSGKGHQTEDEDDSPIVNLSGKEHYRFNGYKYVVVK